MERAADVRALAGQAAQLQDQVAGVEAAHLAQDSVVAGEELGELDLAPRPLAGGGAGGRLDLALGPLAKSRRGDALGLQQVDPPQQPGQEPRRVAADLVAAKREVVDSVEQDREPVAQLDRAEERVQAGLDREVAKQALGDLRVGADRELGVGTVQEPLGPLAHPGGCRARPGEDEHAVGLRTVADQRREAHRQGLAAAGAGGPQDQHRALAVPGDPLLCRCQASLHA